MTPVLKKWLTLRSTTLSENEWNSLRRDEVRLPDGSTADDYYVSIRPDLAVVFPVTAAGQVVLVRQYKHGVAAITIELPSGTFAAGSPLRHARRELREETGYGGDHWRRLGDVYADATKNTNRVHAFLALDVEWRGPQRLDGLEARSGIEVRLKPLAEIEALIDAGRIRDQASVVTCLLALRWLSCQSGVTAPDLR